MAAESPYHILGLEEGASAREIERAYRRAAMRWHPDRNPDDPSAVEHFRAARRAFEILRARNAGELRFHNQELNRPDAPRDAAGDSPPSPENGVYSADDGRRDQSVQHPNGESDGNAADGGRAADAGESGRNGGYERWGTLRAGDDVPWLALLAAGSGLLFYLAEGGLLGFAGLSAGLLAAYSFYKPAQTAGGKTAEWAFKAAVRVFLVVMLGWWVWLLGGEMSRQLCAWPLLRGICGA